MKKAPAAAVPVPNGHRLPLYQKIKEELCARIVSGELEPNEAAPSEREIIEHFKVSSITARRCLNDLEQEGYVRRVRGRGTFVLPFDTLTLSRHIGVFFNELASLSNTFLNAVVSGIAAECKTSGFEPELLSWAPVRSSNSPSDALTELIRHRRLEGLIILSPVPMDWLKGVIREHLPMVSVNFGYDDPMISSVLADRREATRQRSRALASFGHRRVAAIKEVFPQAGNEGVVSDDIFVEETGVEFLRVTVPYADAIAMDQAISRFLSEPNPPTAYFASGYEVALQVRQSLEERGYRIPEDVSLLAICTPPGPSHFYCENMPAAKMGAETVRRVMASLQGRNTTKRVTRIPTTISVGRTLGPAGSVGQTAKLARRPK